MIGHIDEVLLKMPTVLVHCGHPQPPQHTNNNDKHFSTQTKF